MLAESAGIQAIGPLLEMFNGGLGRKSKPIVFDTLTSLLPRLKTSDALLLGSRHRAILYDLIHSSMYKPEESVYRTEFCVAALKALEQIGDTKALTVVERLAKVKAHNLYQQRIKEAAIACLPMLQANLGAVQSNQTLLRASEPAASPEMLLRPAAPVSSEQSEQLLRPH